MTAPRNIRVGLGVVPGQSTGPAADPAPPAPPHPLHMGLGQRWAYSLGEAATPARGVYRHDRQLNAWEKVAPLPYVLDRIIHRDGSGGQLVTLRLALSPLSDADSIAIVERDQLKDGTWRNSFVNIAFSYEDKITKAVGTAIDEIALAAPACEVTPRWRAGQLELPPLDLRPDGYGTPSADPAGARAGWVELAQIAARNPRLAVVIGAGVGSLYVSPLGWQPHLMLLTGGAAQGKTTALTAAAAVVGRPGTLAEPGVVRSWNATLNGLAAKLGELGCLPAFFDEIGAGNMRVTDLEALVFRICQGASRLQAKRTGGNRSTAGWAGVMFATGNDSITGRIANEGITRRVVEIPTPIVATKADAERASSLAHDHHGWPLAWMLDAGMDVEAFRTRVAAAREEIGACPGGGPAEDSIAGHLALALAGAGWLSEHLGVDLYGPALGEVRERLRGAAEKLADRGASPGDRLLDAVYSAWTVHPDAFPTRHLWATAQSGAGEPLRRGTEGFDVQDEDKIPGDLAVLSLRLEAIAQAAGITDHTPGLDELLTRGLVMPGATGRRTWPLKMLAPARRPVPERTYLFRFPEDAPDDATGPANRPGGNHPAETGNREDQATEPALTCANTSGATLEDEAGRLPVVTTTGNHPGKALTCANTETVTAVTTVTGAVDPYVTQGESTPSSETDSPPNAGPCAACQGEEWCGLGWAADDRLPCIRCGRPTLARTRCGAARHGGCQPDGTPTEDATESAPDIHPDQPSAQPGQPSAQPAPRNAGRRLRPIPAGATGAPIERIDPAAELRNFAKAVRKSRPDATEADLRAGLEVWHRVTEDLRFVSFPGEVGLAAYARLVTRNAAMVMPTKLEAHADLVQSISENLTLFRDHLSPGLTFGEPCWITGNDVNAQFPAAGHSVEVGDGDPNVIEAPRSITGLLNLPGYVQLGADVDTRHPAFGTLAGGSWLTTQTAKYLHRDRGIELPATRAVVWPKKGRRLAVWSKLFSQAYRELKDTLIAAQSRNETDLASEYALVAVKGVYTSFLGGMLRSEKHNKTLLLRVDWSDQLVTLAGVNMLRALDKAAATGHAPVGVWRDTAWFASTGPDPVRPAALTFSTQPGKWKTDRHALMTPEMRAAYTEGSPALFRDTLIAAVREQRNVAEDGPTEDGAP